MFRIQQLLLFKTNPVNKNCVEVKIYVKIHVFFRSSAKFHSLQVITGKSKLHFNAIYSPCRNPFREDLRGSIIKLQQLQLPQQLNTQYFQKLSIEKKRTPTCKNAYILKPKYFCSV
jgi:hypothetical protein